MRWKVVPALVAVCVGVTAGAAIAGTESGHHVGAGGVRLTRPSSGPEHPDRPEVSVRPATGAATTRFLVSFRAPDAAGATGLTNRRYVVQASGPRRSGCRSAESVQLLSARKGQLVHVALRPYSRWCAGVYRGTAIELVRPVCRADQACPQFIAVIPVGRFRFTVRSPGAD